MEDSSSCRLGRMCQNPNCPSCFPQLSANARADVVSAKKNRVSSTRRPWGDDDPEKLPVTVPERAAVTKRSISADLVELVVIMCTKDGAHRHVLKAIRCHRNETLSQIRSVMINDIPSLPPKFSFIRIVGGHVVHLSADQESGSKAYKAKHFASPHAPTPQLLIYDREPEPGQSPEPMRTSNMRQVSEGVIEFCVRCMVEGKQEQSKIVGMIRLHRDATMNEIRKDLDVQLPHTAPTEYRFVRMLQNEVTLLTTAQEKSWGKQKLKAYHFAPPYTSKAEIILLTRKSYIEGEVIEDETKTRELKSLASALYNPQRSDGVQHQQKQRMKGKNPRDMVKEKVATYVNAFLNSSGGVLIFGANDNGVVERVPISGAADKECRNLDERVKLARSVKDDIRKLVDSTALHMDPVVDDDLVTTLFVPVRRRNGYESAVETDETVFSAEQEIYNVIEVHVKPGRRSLYFLDKHSLCAFERRDGSTHLMDEDTITEALKRGSKDVAASPAEDESTWQGGWRQLRSPFDFNALMRRLSDPWAGREWLFTSTRQFLFHSMHGASHTTTCGIALVAKRGMGKSAFMSELALRPKNVTHLDVVAHHLCRQDDPDTLDPSLFVQSIAAMLARRFKEYRSLMTDSLTHSEGDSIGRAMLRALRPEHCDSNPDDAFLRGVLYPLREIETRRREFQDSGPEKARLPVVVLVDAIDESLGAESDRYTSRQGSPTIAHLLERTLLSCGLPQWIKIVISFRRDLIDAPGPIKRLAEQLDLIDLDPDPAIPTEGEQAREDIRLFVEAYLERMRMTSPLGSRVGSGSWNPSIAAERARELSVSREDQCIQWQYEDHPGSWVAFDEISQAELDCARKTGLRQCYLVSGKQTRLLDFMRNTQHNLKSVSVRRIRLGKSDPPVDDLDEKKSVKVASHREEKAPKGVICSYCNKSGHFKTNCPSELAVREETIKQENALLDALASNAMGNYLYARSVLEDISGGQLQWTEVPSLPSGLDHLYNRFFSLHFGERNTTEKDGHKPALRSVKPVLEVLLAQTNRGLSEREIMHAVLAGGACDPTIVPFCLRDIRWALDVENTGKFPRYSLRHESIRAWLREDLNASALGLREGRGHSLLAASLLQRCWPQQRALSRWLQNQPDTSVSSCDASSSDWYRWSGWEPNTEDEDVFMLVKHLVMCELGDYDERVALLKSIGKENLNSIFRGKTTALYSASATGDVRAVRLLLDAQASPNISVRGRSPLHVAAGKGNQQIAEMLLSAGADVSATTSSGRTSLLNAAARGSTSTVKCILTWIGKLESRESTSSIVDCSQTDTGRTPLSVAVEEGHDEVVRLLLDAKASVVLADRWGRTPLHYGKILKYSIRHTALRMYLYSHG